MKGCPSGIRHETALQPSLQSAQWVKALGGDFPGGERRVSSRPGWGAG